MQYNLCCDSLNLPASAFMPKCLGSDEATGDALTRINLSLTVLRQAQMFELVQPTATAQSSTEILPEIFPCRWAIYKKGGKLL